MGLTLSEDREINTIIKRDGSKQPYNYEKIISAIRKAFKAVYPDLCEATISDYTLRVSNAVSTWLHGTAKSDTVHTEEIQDVIECMLMQLHFHDVAKAFILYRAEHSKIRAGKIATDIIGTYLDKSDWRVQENSNSGYCYASLMNHVAGTMIANYCLENIYSHDVANAHIDGDIHLHDLSAGVVPYCAGWSIRDVLMKGFIGKYGRANAGPAKHLDTALLQSANFLCTLQTEWAGAQAFNSFDTFMAPFVRHDNLDYESVKQRVQQFVFGLNIASRYGQCPFTNLTFDLACPEDMKDQPVIIGGKLDDSSTYGEYQKEQDMINKAFIEVMMGGDKDGRIFSFPIPTYNITEDFPWDSEVAHLLFKMTGKLGAPYFQNFINTDLNPQDVRSMCCRLRLDLTDIRKHTGGLFGAGDQTGSIGVVSINIPRIAYLSKDKEEPVTEFYRLLDQRLTLAKKALEAKRREINKNFDNGLMPYSQEYLPHKFTRHFSTIGVIGFNEAVQMLFGKTMGDASCIDFVQQVLKYMLRKCENFTQETGNMYNLEAVPGEGLSYRFAKIDKKRYPDIITAGNDNPYYTNSSQLPVNYTDDPFEALELQDELQSTYSSGTVLHFYMGECIDDEAVVAKFVKNVCYKSKIPFFSLTPEFSICPKCGYIVGAHEFCPNHV